MKNFLTKLKKINFKVVIIRILLLCGLIGLAFIPIYLIMTYVDANLFDAFVSGSQTKIIEAVSHYDNFLGAIIIAILQIIQDWSIIIPSAPIHIAAGVVLGTWSGFIVCHVADVLSNMYVFLLYRKIKNKMDAILPISESNGTIKKIKEGKSPIYMVILVCLMPAVPNGFIPYAAVNAKMSLKDYTLAVVIGAAPPKIILTAVGEEIFMGNWWLLIVLIVIALLGAYILMKYQKQTVELFLKIKNKIFGKKSGVNVITKENNVDTSDEIKSVNNDSENSSDSDSENPSKDDKKDAC